MKKYFLNSWSLISFSHKNRRRIKKCQSKFDRLQYYLLSFVLHSFFSSLNFKFPDLFHFLCPTFFIDTLCEISLKSPEGLNFSCVNDDFGRKIENLKNNDYFWLFSFSNLPSKSSNFQDWLNPGFSNFDMIFFRHCCPDDFSKSIFQSKVMI